MTGRAGSSPGNSWRSTGGSQARCSPRCCGTSRLALAMSDGTRCWRRWLSIWRHSTISRLPSGLSCVSCSGRGSPPSLRSSALTHWYARRRIPQARGLLVRCGPGSSVTEPGGVLLDRVQLERAFTALGERLVLRGVVADAFVVGGAAMALAYDATRVTRDVDSLFVPHGCPRPGGSQERGAGSRAARMVAQRAG